MSTIKATNIQPQSDSDPLVFSTNATERMRIPSSGGVSITGGATVSGGISITGGANVSGDISITGGATVSGGITVGNLQTSNIMAKLNNTVENFNGSIGCVVPMYAEVTSGKCTIPLPPGTWFVYGTGIENEGSTDEDTAFVMSRVWTVANNTYLRFRVSGSSNTTTTSALSYSVSNTTSLTAAEGSWISFDNTNAYPFSGLTFGSVFTSSQSTNRGVLFPTSNTMNTFAGFAIRLS